MISELVWVLRKDENNVFDELSKTNQKHKQNNFLYILFYLAPIKKNSKFNTLHHSSPKNFIPNSLRTISC